MQQGEEEEGEEEGGVTHRSFIGSFELFGLEPRMVSFSGLISHYSSLVALTWSSYAKWSGCLMLIFHGNYFFLVIIVTNTIVMLDR